MLTICSLEIPSEHTARREKRRRYHSPLYMQKDETETENQGSRLAKGDNDITPSKSSCKWSSLASTSIYKQSTIALERHCLAAGRNKVQYSESEIWEGHLQSVSRLKLAWGSWARPSSSCQGEARNWKITTENNIQEKIAFSLWFH